MYVHNMLYKPSECRIAIASEYVDIYVCEIYTDVIVELLNTFSTKRKRDGFRKIQETTKEVECGEEEGRKAPRKPLARA